MKKYIIPFLFLILLATAVMAVDPHQTFNPVTAEEFIEIVYPKFEVIKFNQSFNLHTHIYNSTSGKLLTNETANCSVHIYNHSGSHILQQNLTFDSNGLEFKLDIGAGNFTQQGKFSYIIWCNTNTTGGFESGLFTVTRTGEAIDTSGFSLLWAILLPLIMTCLLWVFAFKLDSTLQPFKVFFTGVGFAFLFLPLQALLVILQDFPSLLEVATTVTYIYGWVFWLIMVFIVLNFVISILEYMRARKGGSE
jgi:hypothetical protein